MTDLDGSFGEYCDCDVLWAVVGGNRNNVPYGDIIYIDNRRAIPRSSSQKEDIKIILEF